MDAITMQVVHIVNFHFINRLDPCFKEYPLDYPHALNREVPDLVLSIYNSVGFTCTAIELYSLQDPTGNNAAYYFM